jgi:hypothetical protein
MERRASGSRRVVRFFERALAAMTPAIQTSALRAVTATPNALPRSQIFAPLLHRHSFVCHHKVGLCACATTQQPAEVGTRKGKQRARAALDSVSLH